MQETLVPFSRFSLVTYFILNINRVCVSLPISQVFSPLASVYLLSSLYFHHAYLVPFTRSSSSVHYLWVLRYSAPSPFSLHSALLRIFSLFHASPNTTFGLRTFTFLSDLEPPLWSSDLNIGTSFFWFIHLYSSHLTLSISESEHQILSSLQSYWCLSSFFPFSVHTKIWTIFPKHKSDFIKLKLKILPLLLGLASKHLSSFMCCCAC